MMTAASHSQKTQPLPLRRHGCRALHQAPRLVSPPTSAKEKQEEGEPGHVAAGRHIKTKALLKASEGAELQVEDTERAVQQQAELQAAGGWVEGHGRVS